MRGFFFGSLEMTLTEVIETHLLAEPKASPLRGRFAVLNATHSIRRVTGWDLCWWKRWGCFSVLNAAHSIRRVTGWKLWGRFLVLNAARLIRQTSRRGMLCFTTSLDGKQQMNCLASSVKCGSSGEDGVGKN